MICKPAVHVPLSLTCYFWQRVKVETTFAQSYCQFEFLQVNLALVNATSVSFFCHIMWICFPLLSFKWKHVNLLKKSYSTYKGYLTPCVCMRLCVCVCVLRSCSDGERELCRTAGSRKQRATRNPWNFALHWTHMRWAWVNIPTCVCVCVCI